MSDSRETNRFIASRLVVDSMMGINNFPVIPAVPHLTVGKREKPDKCKENVVTLSTERGSSSGVQRGQDINS